MQIALVVVLLIVIFPSKEEQMFVLRTVFSNYSRTLQDGVILLGVLALYFKQFAVLSQCPLYGFYLFEFGLLFVGYFLIEGVVRGLARQIKKWNLTRRTRNNLFRTPKAVIKAREETMYPGRRRGGFRRKSKPKSPVSACPLQIVETPEAQTPTPPPIVESPFSEFGKSKQYIRVLKGFLLQCDHIIRNYSFISTHLFSNLLRESLHKYFNYSRDGGLERDSADIQSKLLAYNYVRTGTHIIGKDWEIQHQFLSEKTRTLFQDRNIVALSPPVSSLSRPLPPLSHRSPPTNIILWTPIVEITQNPLVASTLVSDLDRNKPVACPEIDVWAKNFSGELVGYGVEFGENSLRYFLPNQYSQATALNHAEDMLTRLSTRYPGIDGTCTVQPLVSKEASQLKIWTLRGNMQISSRYGEKLWHDEDRKKIPKIKIISGFLHELRFLQIDLRCIALYKQQPMSKVKILDRPTPPIELELYFIYTVKPGEDAARFASKIRTMLQSLTKHNFEDYKNRCQVIEIQADMVNLVWQHIWTCHQYAWFSPAFVIKSTQFDFSFPRNVKNMAQSYIFPGENVPVLGNTDNPLDYLNLGHVLNYGARTEKMGVLPFLKMQEHVGIFGTTGTGKTYFNRWILSELNRKRPHVGVLILNLAKKKQAGMYQDLVDVVLTYGEDAFEIPYLISPQHQPQNRSRRGTSMMGFQRTAQVLLAALDLRDPYVEVASRILAEAYAADRIPATLDDLFTQISAQVQQYGKDTNLNMQGILENRRGIFKDPLLLEMTRYRDGKCGSWFDWFLNGASVYLDLSPCENSYSQQLLVMLILLTIYFKAEELPPEHPQIKNVVAIDEAHRFLTKFSQSIRDSATADIKVELLTQYLSENRSRGFAMILGDQAPTKLLDAAHQEVGTRITFNIKEHAANLFYSHYEKREIIQRLPARCAHVQYGEKSFLIETPDLSQHSLCTRTPHPPTTAAGEWFYLHVLLDPLYIHPDIVEKQYYRLFSHKIGKLLDQHRYSTAYTLVYSIWNNLLRDVITKNTKSSPSPDLSLFQLLSYIDGRTQLQTQTLRRLRLQWIQFHIALRKKDPMMLSKNDVRAFYSDLQELCRVGTLSMVESKKEKSRIRIGGIKT